MKKTYAFMLLTAMMAFLALPSPSSAQVSGEVVVGTAPPPVREEVIPAAPTPTAVWHKGHYRYIDGSYVWVPGHWVERPHPNAMWVEPQWVQRGNGYVFVEGHWQ